MNISSPIWNASNISVIQALPDPTSQGLIRFIESAWGIPCTGEIQTTEDYDIEIPDEQWNPSSSLIRCPEWYSSILKAIPLSGLYFLAPSPEEPSPEEHIILPLPGWSEVADMYPFFVTEFTQRGEYPIASSGFGYLVIRADGSADDPIDRWDGSAMQPAQAFSSFHDLVSSMTPYPS